MRKIFPPSSTICIPGNRAITSGAPGDAVWTIQDLCTFSFSLDSCSNNATFPLKSVWLYLLLLTLCFLLYVAIFERHWKYSSPNSPGWRTWWKSVLSMSWLPHLQSQRLTLLPWPGRWTRNRIYSVNFYLWARDHQNFPPVQREKTQERCLNGI